MRDVRQKTIALLCLGFAGVVHAQPSQATATVPKLVRFSGSFRPANGMPAQPVESVTLSVYGDRTGGTALWQETQNVAVDGEGKYSVLMGSTQNDGVPLDLLSAGEPRWLGVQFNRPGEPEQPRVLMASVPYALKSVDAETLGGKPASAYLLAGAASSGITTSAGAASSGTSSSAITSGTVATTLTTVMTDSTTAVKPRTISGQQGYVPYFTDNTNDLGNSVMQQASGSIGVGTVPGAGAASTPSLDLRTYPFAQIGMAQTTDYLTFFSSDAYGPAIYWNPGHDLRFGKGGTPLYNAFGFIEQMRIQSSTGNIGIGTQAPGSKLDVAGSINAAGNLTAAGTVSTGSANVTGALSAGSLNTGNITSTGTITLANVNATGAVTAGGNITTTAGSVNAATVYSSSDISLNGNIYDGGHIIYQQPYGSVTNTALGVGANAGSDSSGMGNTTSGYCAGGNGGGCSNGGNARLMPRAPHAQGSGNRPHPDASGGPSGSFNTAHGYLALSSLSSGYYNTAHGAYALSSLTGGYFNTAHGYQALSANTTAFSNTAIGAFALSSNTTANGNTATGLSALEYNTTGGDNTANGAGALADNTMGFFNTASGGGALANNTTGSDNTAIGFYSLEMNGTGTNNIAVGFYAATNVSGGNSNNIHIGTEGASTDNGVIRIGGNTALGDYHGAQTAFFASGIGNATVSGVPVLVNTSTGQLGVASSSRRFKEDIQDMGDTSHGLMRLRPVTFRYKQPFDDGAKPTQYGLIAEEVDEVYPDLVAHSADGQIETVKYQVLDSMLLNEVQRQQAEIGAQKEQIRRLEQQNVSLLERLDKMEAVLGVTSRASGGAAIR